MIACYQLIGHSNYHSWFEAESGDYLELTSIQHVELKIESLCLSPLLLKKEIKMY